MISSASGRGRRKGKRGVGWIGVRDVRGGEGIGSISA